MVANATSWTANLDWLLDDVHEDKPLYAVHVTAAARYIKHVECRTTLYVSNAKRSAAQAAADLGGTAPRNPGYRKLPNTLCLFWPP